MLGQNWQDSQKNDVREATGGHSTRAGLHSLPRLCFTESVGSRGRTQAWVIKSNSGHCVENSHEEGGVKAGRPAWRKQY